jgi:hypothetical protein
MRRHAENAKVQEEACRALQNFAAKAKNKAKIGAQVENRHKYTRVYVALTRAQKQNVATSNRKHTHARRGGLKPWSRQCDATPRNQNCKRSRAGSCGASPPTIPRTRPRLARRWRTDINTHEYMWPSHGRRNQISQSAIAITHTHTQGGIEAVVTAMRRHAENARLQENSCAALWSLALNDENQAKIGAQVESIHEYI